MIFVEMFITWGFYFSPRFFLWTFTYLMGLGIYQEVVFLQSQECIKNYVSCKNSFLFFGFFWWKQGILLEYSLKIINGNMYSLIYISKYLIIRMEVGGGTLRWWYWIHTVSDQQDSSDWLHSNLRTELRSTKHQCSWFPGEKGTRCMEHSRF